MYRDLSDFGPLIQIQITQRNVPFDSLARNSKNMADSSRAPIKDALKVIMTEQDTLGAAVGT